MKLTWIERENIERKIYESIGEASVCWSETPSGVFDSTRCKNIAESLLSFIIEEIESN